MALKSELFDNFNKEYPAVLSRKERRKIWRSKRRKTNKPAPDGMGTHAKRAEQVHSAWSNLTGISFAKNFNRKKGYEEVISKLQATRTIDGLFNGEPIYNMASLRDRIIEVLSKPNGDLGLTTLAECVYSPVPPVRKIVKDLVTEGVVKRVKVKKDNGLVRHVILRKGQEAPETGTVVEETSTEEEAKTEGVEASPGS